mgnify:CR=1 FL=1
MTVWIALRFHPIDAGDLILGVFSNRAKADQAIEAAVDIGKYYGEALDKDDFDYEEWTIDQDD